MDFHQVPGRIRLRSQKVKGNEVLARRVRQYMLQVSGILAIDVRPRTGSIVIHYDTHLLSADEVLGHCAQGGIWHNLAILPTAKTRRNATCSRPIGKSIFPFQALNLDQRTLDLMKRQITEQAIEQAAGIVVNQALRWLGGALFRVLARG